MLPYSYLRVSSRRHASTTTTSAGNRTLGLDTVGKISTSRVPCELCGMMKSRRMDQFTILTTPNLVHVACEVARDYSMGIEPNVGEATQEIDKAWLVLSTIV